MTDFPDDSSLDCNDSSGDGEKWLGPGRDGRTRLLSKVGL